MTQTETRLLARMTAHSQGLTACHGVRERGAARKLVKRRLAEIVTWEPRVHYHSNGSAEHYVEVVIRLPKVLM